MILTDRGCWEIRRKTFLISGIGIEKADVPFSDSPLVMHVKKTSANPSVSPVPAETYIVFEQNRFHKYNSR